MWIFRVVVAVISMLATATGLALDITQVVKISTRWWTLIAFAIFCIFMIWMIVELRNRNRELENKKPSITVVPMLMGDLWYLEVNNDGETGIFTAEVCNFGNEVSPAGSKYESIGTKYNALWGKTSTDKSEIMKGQSDIIRIASIEYTNGDKYFVMKGYDPVKQSPYTVRHIEYDGFRDSTRQQIIQINISSDPSLKDGAFIMEYIISLKYITQFKPKKRISILDKYFLGEIDDDRNKISVELANLIPEGEHIREQCYDQKTKVPEKEAKDWSEKVAICLDKLGSHYRLTFYNSDGLPAAKILPMYSADHQRVALFISYRLMRIQQFLGELRQK